MNWHNLYKVTRMQKWIIMAPNVESLKQSHGWEQIGNEIRNNLWSDPQTNFFQNLKKRFLYRSWIRDHWPEQEKLKIGCA